MLDNIQEIGYDNGFVPTAYYCCDTIQVNVDNKQFTLNLTPAVAAFRLQMKDAIPINSGSLTFEVSNASNYMNGLNGLAASEKIQTYTSTINLPETVWGNAGQSARVCMFLPMVDMETNSNIIVKVTAYSSDGSEITSYTFTNVPMRRGCITTYSGNFFGDGTAFSITVNDTWDEINETF